MNVLFIFLHSEDNKSLLILVWLHVMTSLFLFFLYCESSKSLSLWSHLISSLMRSHFENMPFTSFSIFFLII